MFIFRPSEIDDAQPMADMIRARALWMAEKGLRGADGWHRNADELSTQAGDPAFSVWVLATEHGEIVGRTMMGEQSPSWCWTEEERVEPAIFLSGTVTDPGYQGQHLGYLMARHALDYAARNGKQWVRRGTGPDPKLVHYYQHVQGWKVIRTVEHRGFTTCALSRRAEPQNGLEATREI